MVKIDCQTPQTPVKSAMKTCLKHTHTHLHTPIRYGEHLEKESKRFHGQEDSDHTQQYKLKKTNRQRLGIPTYFFQHLFAFFLVLVGAHYKRNPHLVDGAVGFCTITGSSVF